MLIAVPYIIFYILLLLLYLLKRNFNIDNRVELFALFIYLVFYGLRGYIFTDCFQYLDFFSALPKQSLSVLNYYHQYESGYVLLNVIVSKFTNNPFVFQFIMTLIDVCLLYVILKKETGRYFLFAFALLIPFWDGIQMNLFRNIKAILILFYGIRYIRERNIFKYFGCVIVACLFHQSSIFFAPLYFFINKPLKKVMFGACVCSIILYFLGATGLISDIQYLGSLLGDKFTRSSVSFTEDATNAGFTLGFIFRLMLMYILIKHYDIMARYNLCMLNCLFLYVCLFTAFNSLLIIRDRLSALFALSAVIMLPFYYERIRLKKEYYMKIILFIFMLGQVYVQHNNLGAVYENLITGISDERSAILRIMVAADVYNTNVR